MKLLITGGTGMLGSAILRLYHQQHDLHFLGRNLNIAEELVKTYCVTPHICDLADKEQLKKACEGVDAIIHCAALSSPWGTYQEFYQANVAGTQNLLDIASQMNVQVFVHISTTSVYFDEQDRWLIKESDPVAGIFCNDYAKTKYQAEQLVLSSSVNSIILRPRGVFGPNDRAIMPRLLKAVRGKTLLLPSGRNPVLDMTYVDNVADAALLACKHAKEIESGTIINISNDQPMPIEQILETLFTLNRMNIRIKRLPYSILLPILTLNERLRRKLPGKPEPKITRYSAGLFHFHQTLDITRAKALLGYQPKVSIAEGIQRYVSWSENKTV